MDIADGERGRAPGHLVDRRSFDDVVVPHLDAAHRLARWLTGNDHDADDVVQDASLRAFRYLRTFSGRNGRAWFLTIVRNTCSEWYHRNRTATEVFDEEQHSSWQLMPDQETMVLRSDSALLLERAMRDLPERFRELLVLREFEGLSYRQLANVLEVPIGTVMSSLSRARHALRRALVYPPQLSR